LIAQATTYTYDAFSNLTQVTQDVQTRIFTYSSLISAINPESGSSSYTYDNNANLMSIDRRPGHGEDLRPL
jgi:uncharacterized protein RhaS with RHS repeats